MPLDRALRATIRDFSTFFLALFLVLGPLHLVLAMVFHDVLAVRELHEAIAGFPSSRQVRGVGQEALSQARIAAWILVVVELLLIPLFTRVAGHVIEERNSGGVPTAIGAWRKVRAATGPARGQGISLSLLLGSAAVALAIGFVTRAILMIVVDLLPDTLAFAGIGLTEATSRCAGGAFLIVGLIYATGGSGRPTETLPELY